MVEGRDAFFLSGKGAFSSTEALLAALRQQGGKDGG